MGGPLQPDERPHCPKGTWSGLIERQCKTAPSPGEHL